MFIVQFWAILQPHLLPEHIRPKNNEWFYGCVNRLKAIVWDTWLNTGAGLSLGGK